MIAEFPLLLFTTLTGLSAGTYAMLTAFKGWKIDARASWFAVVACLALLGAGSLGVIGHLHHPERMFNACSNPSSSLTQEAVCVIAVGVAMLSDLAMTAKLKKPIVWLRTLVALLCAMFIFVMAHAYFTVWGNVAWASWQTVPFFVLCDFAVGAVLVCAVLPELLEKKALLVALIALQAVSAVSMLLEGLHFGVSGFSPEPYYVGCVFAVVAAILLWAAVACPKWCRALCIAAFIACFVGLVVARYAFYATGLYIL